MLYQLSYAFISVFTGVNVRQVTELTSDSRYNNKTRPKNKLRNYRETTGNDIFQTPHIGTGSRNCKNQ
ncbi:MAG TPA: hypothetical protein DD473_03955 [Planctomycetaceae bacterium]|nr:hypothetical protein [Planctomycetaceae bacterium]